MGHLAIVNNQTIQQINNNNPYISIGGRLNSYPYKTISDLFADALLVREGDIIFTWMVDSELSTGQGFDRYYIANGDILFDSSSDYPIKIGIKEGYKFNKALAEEQALDLFGKHLLWNAIGKKSLGRGRSLSHQTIDEDEYLMNLLKGINPGRPQRILSAASSGNNQYLPISIKTFSSCNSNQATLRDIKSLQLNSTIWNNGDIFLYEKTLEAYLCENIDKPILNSQGQQTDLLTILGYAGYRVRWAGNYLPYGVAGKNIDLVCEITNAIDVKVLVIELKVDAQSYKKYSDIANFQLSDYVSFIKKAFESYRGAGVVVEPVVITHMPRQRSRIQNIKQQPRVNSAKWIGYNITQTVSPDPAAENYQVIFERLL